MKRKLISKTLGVALASLMLGAMLGGFPPTARAAATIYVPDNYPTIQAAVNAASPGDTIIVRSGTYTENVVINKSLSLIGENRTTIIDGNGIDDAVRVTASDVLIRGFTIRNARWAGIKLDFHSNNNIIVDNRIMNNDSGIVLQDSSRNRIINNSSENNTWNGIILANNEGEWGNQIISNNITGNYNGVNSYDIGKINPNVFYLNNLVNNTRQVVYYYDNSTDNWNSPEEMTYTYNGTTYTNYLGNYWSDYGGTDNNSDGIGDTPYNINSDSDTYPLIAPFGNYAIFAPGVQVMIGAPAKVAPGRNFTATVEISQVQSFDAANFDVSFNPAVLRLDSVTSGNISGATVPVDAWNQREPGRFTIVVNIPGLTGANGTGSLAVLHFQVTGSIGNSSSINLSNGVLSNTGATEILATWLGDFVEVAIIPGDANGDGLVNAIDITKVERIIAGLDTSTPGADANQDGNVNALDITKVERIIVGLG